MDTDPSTTRRCAACGDNQVELDESGTCRTCVELRDPAVSTNPVVTTEHRDAQPF